MLSENILTLKFSSQAALPCQCCVEVENRKPRKLLKAIESYDVCVCMHACMHVCMCMHVMFLIYVTNSEKTMEYL